MSKLGIQVIAIIIGSVISFALLKTLRYFEVEPEGRGIIVGIAMTAVTSSIVEIWGRNPRNRRTKP